MISIIVCSVNAALFAKLEANISNTIGTEFEIIKIDNSNNQYSISSAYNIGAASAKSPFLCFIHEDIIFHSTGWGAELQSFFETNKEAGLVGLAGSKYKSLSPGSWVNGQSSLDCFNLIQHNPKNNENEIQNFNPDQNKLYVEVQTIDGLFLFTTRHVWSQMRFDETTFKGFHCYDLDFALQVGRKYKIYVTYTMLLEHLSMGSLNNHWIEQSILLSEKWKDVLPVGKLQFAEKRKLEWKQKRLFFQKMLIYGSSSADALSVLFRFGYVRFFSFSGNIRLISEIIGSILKKLRNSIVR
jgi:hypothetical protein